MRTNNLITLKPKAGPRSIPETLVEIKAKYQQLTWPLTDLRVNLQFDLVLLVGR